MPAVCFYFQVHQPYRLRPFTIFDVGADSRPSYFDEAKNAEIIKRVADKCYRPTNALLLEQIRQHGDKFSVAFSLTGTVIEQLAAHAPDVLDSFRALAKTGQVELLCETDLHSLSAVFDWNEFAIEVEAHKRRITDVFGVTPTTFRNTELIYSDALARQVERLGFSAVLLDGVPRVLGGRSAGHVYTAAGTNRLPILTKNSQLSDDIAFRFSSRAWSEWPLTAPKFAAWVRALAGADDTVNLFLDYETFGEHQWESTGIFDFLRALPAEILRYPENRFVTPATLARTVPSQGLIDCPDWISWADIDRDLTAWLGNSLQHEAARQVYDLREPVLASGDAALIQSWQRLLTSDHFYYMCLKWFADGDVHKYFSPYGSPYDAYIYYINVLQDIRVRCGIERVAGRTVESQPS
jgi:alpha-amylase